MTKMSHWCPKGGIYISHLYDIICYIGIFRN
nr:MAG TPA: hypothetical protein [Caudoviricetes sp.]DAX44804.1 MAG TPA: hypothetical protein [Caudoviricetes sp.]